MKLEIIHDAAIAVGLTPPAVEYDGSDEWTMGSTAFDRKLPVILARHTWNFATTTALLGRLGDSPVEPWTDQFQRPPDCLQLIGVADPDTGAGIAYTILDNTILANQTTARAHYVRLPSEETWAPLFREAMVVAVEAAFYRSMDEHDAAARRDQYFEAILGMAATRTDQQAPKRALLRSGVREARSTRRGG